MMKAVELKTVVCEAQAILSKMNLDMPGYDTQMSVRRVVEGMMIEIRASIWGEDQAPICIEHSWPATWWQHFKRDVLRSKKVRMHTEQAVIDPKVLYPQLKVSVPKEQHVLHMMVRKESDG